MADVRCVIIGTAGHIDHGKTSLVQALTGKNTDSLKEERERGISIDIDFAGLSYPDGTLIGMVDVPGHERFIRNMVAGAVGMDAALLVIDIQEGMKPQTLEHLAILELLGVKHAVIALTKVDLAEDEWIDLVQATVREALQTTPFAQAPTILTSTKTGLGVEELKSALKKLADELVMRDATGAFRMPIDKVFSVPGYGTVVSGTVWRGRVSLGDTLDCLPNRRAVRVRGIQVHGQAVQSAVAGMRAALNITNLDKHSVKRGHVLAATGTLNETKLVDVQLSVLHQAVRPLQHRERVHVHSGTAEGIGRVLLLATDELHPGDTGFAQIFLERPLVCEPMDPFIIRTYSPVTTIGGGTIVDSTPRQIHRRKRTHIIEMLAQRQSDSPFQRLLAMANQMGAIDGDRVSAQLGVTSDEAVSLLDLAAQTEELQRLPGGWYASATVDNTLAVLQHLLTELHQKHRFAAWVPRAVMAQATKKFSSRDVDWLFTEGERRGYWRVHQASIQQAGHEVVLTPDERDIYDRLCSFLHEAEWTALQEEELILQFPKRDRIAKALLAYGREREELVEVATGLWMTAAVVHAGVARLGTLYAEEGPFTVARVRDILGTSRKNVITLLEYLDRVALTRRQDDVRIVTNT
jgi:selenocysteine-specific elongation factor